MLKNLNRLRVWPKLAGILCKKFDGETSDLVFRARLHIVFGSAKLLGC